MSAVKPKILVIRGGAIGDFILTLPAIAALRKQFPRAHLEVLGYPHIARLAVAGGLVDRVQPIEARGLAGFFARDSALDPDLRDYFSEFDLVVSYLYDPDEVFQANLRRCLFGQFITGPHRPNEAEPIHATQVYLKPLERLAIFDADPVPRLALKSQPAALDQLAVHPGSGSEKKNWPEAKWSECPGESFDRIWIYRLGAATRRAQRLEIGAPVRVPFEGLRACRERKIRPAGMRDAEFANSLQPPKRPA